MTTTYFSAVQDYLAHEDDDSELVHLNSILSEALKTPDSPPADVSAAAAAESAGSEAAAQSSPKTPTKDAAAVAMKTFDVNGLREAIIHSILCQNVTIRRATLKRIMIFLSGVFADLTQQIHLQVFLHYCKVDIDLLFQDFKSGDAPKEAITRDLCYDYELATYVDNANHQSPNTKDETVSPISEVNANFLKTVISLPVFLSAFQCVLNDRLKSSMDDDSDKSMAWILNEIQQMRIYNVGWFRPWLDLRGAALTDGILICVGNLCGAPLTENHNADQLTLLCHECAHYLGRLKFNDFNFSSPHKYLPESVSIRTDFVETSTPLEIGRNAELLLFDGITPDWRKSTINAANAFLDRMWLRKTYPLINREEHDQLGLRRRIRRVRYFGVEVRDPDASYY